MRLKATFVMQVVVIADLEVVKNFAYVTEKMLMIFILRMKQGRIFTVP